jgi:TusA-related sulfurtransferase
MSQEFMNLGREYRDMYEQNINQMLEAVINDNRFENTIRHLCKQALDNNWGLEKKVNIVNIITK